MGSRLTQARSWLAIGLFSATLVRAEERLGARVINEDGKTLVVLSNAYEALTFEPARGGRCVSFRFLDNGEELIGPGENTGMFLDHWSKYTYPSDLMSLPYQYEVVKDGEKRVGLKQWVGVPAKGGGKGGGGDIAGTRRARLEEDGLARRGKRRRRGGA
ncbi:MAG: hypothetical protein PHR35_00955 [Kiritimatiellae bacterium]|nr:hypothetical protein [Kiritimatiellia bacterium]